MQHFSLLDTELAALSTTAPSDGFECLRCTQHVYTTYPTRANRIRCQIWVWMCSGCASLGEAERILHKKNIWKLIKFVFLIRMYLAVWDCFLASYTKSWDSSDTYGSHVLRCPMAIGAIWISLMLRECIYILLSTIAFSITRMVHTSIFSLELYSNTLYSKSKRYKHMCTYLGWHGVSNAWYQDKCSNIVVASSSCV